MYNEAALRFSAQWRQEGFEAKGLHLYTNEQGDVLFCKPRLKHPETGEKKFFYMHAQGSKIVLGCPKFENGTPLYNLRELSSKAEEPVLLVEGERCVDWLSRLGVLATTSGGSQTAKGTNWQPLRGRKIIIWPDNDEPGILYAKEVRSILSSLNCNIEQVDVSKLGLGDHGDCIDWLSNNKSASKEQVLALPRAIEVKSNGHPIVVDLHELLKMQIPIREKILPWMPAQSLSMIHAWRGVGKTHVALGIAYAVASGSAFLGWQATKMTKVLYIDGEMSALAMQERLAQIVNASEKEALAGWFKVITPDFQEGCIPDLATQEGQSKIDMIVGDVEVIVIDNLSCLVRGEGKENDSDSWIRVQEWALKHRSQGRSILFIHHSGKNGNQRGTSKREDVLDTVIGLKHAEDYKHSEGAAFEVHFEKARHFHGEAANPFVARLVQKDNKQIWETMPLEENTFEKVVKLSRGGLSQKDISEELAVNKSTVSRHIKTAMEQGILIETPKQNKGYWEQDR